MIPTFGEFTVKTFAVNNQPTRILLDTNTGAFEPCIEYIQRRISDLRMMFQDSVAVEDAIQAGDRVVYEIRAHPFCTDNSDMVMGTTQIFPGKIGHEYHMTKGHFHQRDDQPEIYACVQGKGFLQMMTAEGEYISHPWEAGVVSHIPPQFAHRVVNTGSIPLVFVSFYHLAAGHDYRPVEERGLKYRIIERDGQAVEILSGKWS